ncbi:hypothetical protein [Denitromonas iodatirespirans]|uniref:Uncharacterized protein n=1 Tax=Denitromonas iodatirespirans TaxID=2795389 RepID=A0A944DJT6_DENI1|nr:hypothetical protein [Denitromonas iodatirespirans]MBT0964248.1 hypothetical protein [Denitromonas iodatirespirans]
MPVNTSRIRALWTWLVEARFAWLALGVIAVALAVSLRPHTTEPVIRLTGLILQVLGIGTVIWGISETRALFGHPSFAAKAKSWFGRFPLLRRNVVAAAAATSIGVDTCRARAYTTHGPGPNPTLDSRVDALEKNVDLIHERISSTEREMDEEFRKAGEALRNEEKARQIEDTVIREKLEATGTGGVHISAIGASWLFVGVVLSTAGVEIAELLK